MKKRLTPKQKQFCEEYIVDLNATQAAIRAGYSKRTANEQGSQNLAKLSIQETIQELMAQRSKRTEITADYVLTNLKEVAERCMQRIPVLDSGGKETGKFRFEHTGANKALELLGRHLGMFTDKVEHKGRGTVNIILENERECSQQGGDAEMDTT